MATTPPHLGKLVEAWMPHELLRQFGSLVGNHLNGGWWEFDDADPEHLAAALERTGFDCRHDEDALVVAGGWEPPPDPGLEPIRAIEAAAAAAREHVRAAERDKRLEQERLAEAERLARPPLLHLTPGLPTWVLRKHLAVDENGHLWIDPRTAPRHIGLWAAGDLQLEKRADGTYELRVPPEFRAEDLRPKAADDTLAITRVKPIPPPGSQPGMETP